MRDGRPAFRASRDRWLVSYADLVTILLACFATTYAAARTPDAADADTAPSHVTAPPVASTPQAAPPTSEDDSPAPATPPATTAAAPSALRDLVAPLVEENANQAISVADDARGVVISLPESASFAIGSATLADPARAFLRTLAETLEPRQILIRVEGHTDDVPVSGGRYGSNWELSTARASAVVAFLIGETGFAPERLSAAGYAEFHPRVPNDSADSRARNRRVDVVLIETARP
jgi:chemotaxis protein MotB